MSTLSVYHDWPVKPLSEQSEVLYCPPDAGPDYGTRPAAHRTGLTLARRSRPTHQPQRARRPGRVLGRTPPG
ncbi:Protein of unknown function [Micromonospora lupini str. Lupac 08]|uniref:Uncharacterized protein n=1 Tax=Micromonospora lupini str. Lupac 08 TaxID=1150864 RepID=I0LAP1_9ACTN|nr:Protein of unknown function [Micromonospora lupini str. Lupac 08]